MEGLGLAANVAAVADLSAKVSTLIFQYSKEVLNARSEIKRLVEEVEALDGTFQRAKKLIEKTNGKDVTASRLQLDRLEACRLELEKLLECLKSGTVDRGMRLVGLRALKWPFSKKETETSIEAFQRCRNDVAFSLQIDQT